MSMLKTATTFQELRWRCRIPPRSSSDHYHHPSLEVPPQLFDLHPISVKERWHVYEIAYYF